MKFFEKNQNNEITIKQMNKDIWPSKTALFEAFYGDFYKFILSHDGLEDLKLHNINCVEDFYKYADYYADGKENCYAMGFAFHKYYLKARMDGSLSTEDDDTFIGYCVKNDMYKDFLNFLISFFAYWRNDEGCTCMDPYNYADNFFVSSWAALVDTTKLFYFSSLSVYFWQSFRVKYCLDNIPGVILCNNPLRIAGYEVVGYYDNTTSDASAVSCNTLGSSVLIKRRDFYNYWEKEEKKIRKVYVENFKKVDPA